MQHVISPLKEIHRKKTTFVQTQTKNTLNVTELLFKHNSALQDGINSTASQLFSTSKQSLNMYTIVEGQPKGVKEHCSANVNSNQ